MTIYICKAKQRLVVHPHCILGAMKYSNLAFLLTCLLVSFLMATGHFPWKYFYGILIIKPCKPEVLEKLPLLRAWISWKYFQDHSQFERFY